jgi:hypothetical protein
MPTTTLPRLTWILSAVVLAFCSRLLVADEPRAGTLKLEITDVSASGKVTLRLKNTSSQTIKLWKESNSWGGGRWRVLILKNELVETYFQDPDTIYTVNVPLFSEVLPGKYIQQVLDLSSNEWRHAGSGPVSLRSGDTIVAIYDVPPALPVDHWRGVQPSRMGVWYGVVAAVQKLR